MAITPFKYQPMFPLGEDTTEYYFAHERLCICKNQNRHH